MSERRDMERRHAILQLRKMEAVLDGSRAVADKIRRNMRRDQQRINDYEWELAFDRPWHTEIGRDSMRRAMGQISRCTDTNRRSVEVAEAAERQALENMQNIRRQLDKLDRWGRLATRLEEWFWPVTILRAIWFGRATRNA